MNVERGNIIKYFVQNIFWNILTLAISGAVLQTFLLEYGMPEGEVSIYAGVMQVIQIFVYIVLSPKVDTIRNIIGFTGCGFLFCVPMLLLHMVLPYLELPLHIGVLLLYLAGLAGSLCHGIYSIMGYKIIYRIMDIKSYTKVLSYAVIGGSIACSLASVLFSFFQNRYDYFIVMSWFYVVVFVLTIGNIVVTLRMREIYSPAKIRETKKAKIKLWKYEPFRKLAMANVLRGINNGVISIAVTIGYYMDILDKETAAIIVIVTNIMIIVGNIFITRTIHKISEGRQILIFSVVIALAFPLMLSIKSAGAFILFYGIAYFGIAVISTAVPAAVAKMVDYEVAAQYAGWRMLLFTLGMAISGFICIPMLDLLGGFVTMVLAGLTQLISGIMYYTYFNKRMSIK